MADRNFQKRNDDQDKDQTPKPVSSATNKISDVVWQAIIAGIVAIILAWLQLKTQQKIQDVSDVAVKKAEEVKKDLIEITKINDDKIDDIANVLDDTHDLVNGNMGVQLELNASLSKDKADKSNLPTDIKDSDIADKRLREHMRQQAIIDSRIKDREENAKVSSEEPE